MGSGLATFLEVRGARGEALLKKMFNDSRLFRLIVDEAEKTLAYVDLGIAREYAGLVAEPRVRDAIFPMIEEEYRRTVEAIFRLSGEREIADRFPQFRRRLARRLPTLAQVNRQQIASAAAVPRSKRASDARRPRQLAPAVHQLHCGGVRDDGVALDAKTQRSTLRRQDATLLEVHAARLFTPQHVKLRDTVREFAEQVIGPSARRYDLQSRFPWDNVKQMADLGLFGVPWPKALGGSGHDYLSYIIVIHELAKVDASHAITVSAHTTLGTSPIMDFGTEKQKQRYVPTLAAGKVLAGFGLTEPGAGSDAGGTKTTATDRGDHYVLNGSKIFITHGGVGELFIATARTDPAAQGTHGITVFIVTKDTCDLAETARIGSGHDPSPAEMPWRPGGQEGGQAGLARLRHA